MNPSTQQLDQTVETISSNKREHVLFGLACAILIILFVAAYFQVSSSIQSMNTLDQKTEHLDTVDGLLIDLLDAETGVRGYLITGQHQYLQPYAEAVGHMDTYLDKIASHAEDTGISTASLDKLAILIERYKRIFTSLIVDKTQDDAIDRVDMAFGKDTFDQLRIILSEIKQQLEFDSSSFYQETLQSQSLARWAIFALCTSAFVLLLWLFSTQQRQNQLRQRISDILAHENENLEEQVAQRTSQLSQLAANLTRVNEAEKKRLARELHDDLGASLTAAKMDASWILTQLDETALASIQDKIDRLIQSLDHAITLKRRITTDLLPPLLSELGLFEALRSLAEDLERDGTFQVSIQIPDHEPQFKPEASLALFRIAQEAFTNIRKYSQAQNIALTVQIEPSFLQLSIQDDGIGFNPTNVRDESFGLTSMRHRAHMITAAFEVISDADRGTAISVRMPLLAH